MPKFKKEIVQEGLYFVSDGKGGRSVQFLDRDRFSNWAKKANEMIAKGINIPAPDFHDPNAKPGTRAKDNLGFWESFSVAPTTDSNGVPSYALVGVVDVENEDDAKKIGTSIRETSISVLPEFIDGRGDKWEDVLSHVAIVTKPIEPGQRNFVKQDGELQIAMSHVYPLAMSQVLDAVSQQDKPMSSDDLYELLEKVAGITIPRGSQETLMANLVLALKQKQLCDSSRGSGGTLSKPPKGSDLYEVPVVMSQPDQTPALTPEIVMSHPAFQSLKSQNDGLVNLMTSAKKKELQTRLASLVSRGLVKPEVAEAYKQRIEGFSMSFDGNSSPVTSAVELQIEAIESVHVPLPTNTPVVMNNVPQGHSVVGNPVPADDGQVTDQRAEEIVANLFK